MTDYLPPALLEACVVVGASSEKLQEVCQAVNFNGASEHPLLDPEVLHVLEPPFVHRAHTESEAARLLWEKRRSVLRKRRDLPVSAAASPLQGGGLGQSSESEDASVPGSVDLMAIPQLCFPGGLKLSNEQRDEQFHFLVFTDVFGNKTHGVVMRCYRPVLEAMSFYHCGGGSSELSKLFSAYSFCVISKYPYFTALKDCLSCLAVQLRTCCLSDMEEQMKEFAAKLSLVPIPPPGQLHLVFALPPLIIVLPSQEDKDRPAVDLELHLPFLCFRPQRLLQVISCLLQEQRVVLLSANWARLTLVAESFMVFLQPFTWQQPYVPVLSRGMLDFLMAPTAFLMGCHLHHFEEVASEIDGLILVNIDEGTVTSSFSDPVNLPDIPPAAADCFMKRCESLQVHFDLDRCHHVSSSDIHEQRAQRRTWQHSVNLDIQRVTLELTVNIFRDVSSHLNYEHRVFNSKEFLKTREPAEQLFYKTVLETHVFHSFLKDRLSRKMDSYARMELDTRSEVPRMKTAFEVPHRPTMQEIRARRRTPSTGSRMNKRLEVSLSNPRDNQRNSQLSSIIASESAVKKPVKTFKLPDFPVSLSVHSVQCYYSELIQLLGKSIFSIQNENSTLLARFYYLRGFINALYSRRLDALSDFQNLYKTDSLIVPTQLVTWLVESLQQEERQEADSRPDLQRLILKVKMESEKASVQQDSHVKKFVLPMQNLPLHKFVRFVQESGIVKDAATIHRLFDALADDQPKQVRQNLFRNFYNIWKETEAEAQGVNLPSTLIDKLDSSECVYKLSSCVKTSHGVGKIALTQKRLFLLTEGKPDYMEITRFRDLQEVKIASAPFLLVRSPSLHIQTSGGAEVFEAYLKTETELWSLVVKEMWAGHRMAYQHKDPQYVTQALTNVLLMDTVVRCLQSQNSIIAASKLACIDKISHEESTMGHPNTLETLKHKINPSQDLPDPQTVHALLYTPGQLNCSDSDGEMNPKLWVALSEGKVVVFDAASWSMLQVSIQVSTSQLNCMLGMVQQQVWIGSQDSVIYIIDTHSMSCNKQLTEHRHQVTGLAVDTRDQHNSQHAYSCSCDGTVLQWDPGSLRVKRRFHLKCAHLSSIQIYDGTLWCCCGDGIVELRNDGTPRRKLALPDDLQHVPNIFSSFVVIPEKNMCLLQQGQVWTGCAKSGELCLWQTDNHEHPFKRISLPGSSGVTCMIRVKSQIWTGCFAQSSAAGQCDGRLRGQVLVVDPQSHTVTKELLAHSDTIQALCSVEDRYVVSGSACCDGKIAIWKVE